jgi:hypothetical protein
VVLHSILPILPHRIALILRERIEGRLDIGENAAICGTYPSGASGSGRQLNPDEEHMGSTRSGNAGLVDLTGPALPQNISVERDGGSRVRVGGLS